MNKTEKLTRVKFITKWWNRVGTVDVDYESKKLGEMFADLDQLLQAERWKDKITIQRIYGEWQGMLEGIFQQDIPRELKEKLQEKIKVLKDKK